MPVYHFTGCNQTMQKMHKGLRSIPPLATHRQCMCTSYHDCRQPPVTTCCNRFLWSCCHVFPLLLIQSLMMKQYNSNRLSVIKKMNIAIGHLIKFGTCLCKVAGLKGLLPREVSFSLFDHNSTYTMVTNQVVVLHFFKTKILVLLAP